MSESGQKQGQGWLKSLISGVAYLSAKAGTHRILLLIGLAVGLLVILRETVPNGDSAPGTGLVAAGCLIAAALMRPRPH